MYIYNTPHNTILSLELAYTNQDLDGIIQAKDFETEAKLLLEKMSYDFNDSVLVTETSELLKLSLIQHLQENGFPNFDNAQRVFSELKLLINNIYYLEEELKYPDNTTYRNKVILSVNNNLWKIVSINEV